MAAVITISCVCVCVCVCQTIYCLRCTYDKSINLTFIKIQYRWDAVIGERDNQSISIRDHMQNTSLILKLLPTDGGINTVDRRGEALMPQCHHKIPSGSEDDIWNWNAMVLPYI